MKQRLIARLQTPSFAQIMTDPSQYPLFCSALSRIRLSVPGPTNTLLAAAGLGRIARSLKLPVAEAVGYIVGRSAASEAVPERAGATLLPWPPPVIRMVWPSILAFSGRCKMWRAATALAIEGKCAR